MINYVVKNLIPSPYFGRSIVTGQQPFAETTPFKYVVTLMIKKPFKSSILKTIGFIIFTQISQDIFFFYRAISKLTALQTQVKCSAVFQRKEGVFRNWESSPQ